MAPQIQPDFSEAVEFQPLPPGTYKARITGCEVKQTNAGTQRLLWKLETFGDDRKELNNRTIMHSTPISGKGAGFLKSFYKAAMGKELSGPFDSDHLLGKEVKVTVVEGKNWQTQEPTGFPEVKAVASI